MYSSRSTAACPRSCGVDEVDGDLGFLDPPSRARVLALDADGVDALSSNSWPHSTLDSGS